MVECMRADVPDVKHQELHSPVQLIKISMEHTYI